MPGKTHLPNGLSATVDAILRAVHAAPGISSTDLYTQMSATRGIRPSAVRDTLGRTAKRGLLRRVVPATQTAHTFHLTTAGAQFLNDPGNAGQPAGTPTTPPGPRTQWAPAGDADPTTGHVPTYADLHKAKRQNKQRANKDAHNQPPKPEHATAHPTRGRKGRKGHPPPPSVAASRTLVNGAHRDDVQPISPRLQAQDHPPLREGAGDFLALGSVWGGRAQPC